MTSGPLKCRTQTMRGRAVAQLHRCIKGTIRVPGGSAAAEESLVTLMHMPGKLTLLNLDSLLTVMANTRLPATLWPL